MMSSQFLNKLSYQAHLCSSILGLVVYTSSHLSRSIIKYSNFLCLYNKNWSFKSITISAYNQPIKHRYLIACYPRIRLRIPHFNRLYTLLSFHWGILGHTVSHSDIQNDMQGTDTLVCVWLT